MIMDWFFNALDIGALPKTLDKTAHSAVNGFKANMGVGSGRRYDRDGLDGRKKASAFTLEADCR